MTCFAVHDVYNHLFGTLSPKKKKTTFALCQEFENGPDVCGSFVLIVVTSVLILILILADDMSSLLIEHFADHSEKASVVIICLKKFEHFSYHISLWSTSFYIKAMKKLVF